MSIDDDDRPFGLYERLITAGLKTRLLRFESDTARIVKKELDPTGAHATWPDTSPTCSAVHSLLFLKKIGRPPSRSSQIKSSACLPLTLLARNTAGRAVDCV